MRLLLCLFIWVVACRDETPNNPPLDPGNGTTEADAKGHLDSLATDGHFIGWAFSESESSKSIEIKVYMDGDYKRGELVGEYLADRRRDDINDYFGITGQHAFDFTLPRGLKDDKEHTFYIYAVGSRGLVEIEKSPAKIVLIKDRFIGPPGLPKIFLFPSTREEYEFPIADSNSPLVWIEGILTMFASSAGRAHFAEGQSVDDMRRWTPVEWDYWLDGGRWMEAIIQADDGTLYGYYHNEPASLCADTKTAPRVGAGKSTDGGRTWTDLGIIIQAPEGSEHCDTTNHYFNGGTGDLNALLSRDGQTLYIFVSTYYGSESDQGISVSKMNWAERDHPRGKVTTLENIFPAKKSWHDPEGTPDVFWGPSAHYNFYLNKFVMIMNHATGNGPTWHQEGVYVSYSDDLETWTEPYRFFKGGNWYPHVIGMPGEFGTDKFAGQYSTFKLGQTIRGTLQFGKEDEKAPVPME